MSFKEYKLSAVLRGHDQDIKDLASIGGETLVSASRDSRVLVWKKEQDGSWSSSLNYKSEKFVNAVTITSKGPSNAGYYVASGGQDALINLSGLEASLANPSTGSGFNEPDFILLGHEKNVCSLAAFPNSDKQLLISGSWDANAIVWEDNVEKFKLTGHKAAVWDAQFVSPETFLTCSADKTIKFWEKNKLARTFTGIHDDVIRSLVVLNNKTFLSASNDGTIKFVDLISGSVLKTLRGHNSFIYQIKLLDSKTLISCGEDRSVKVWDLESGKSLQTIFVPSISVWSISVLSNKDIAVGGSDATIRVFSNDVTRIDSLAHEQLLEEIKSQSVNPQAIDDTKLVDASVLDVPGDKEGRTVMVKSPTGVIEAHQWSNGTWQKIGEVLGGAGGGSSNMASSGKKTEYLGKQYDFVFDVDVKDGEPPLKLPFNLSDNPYSAAEKFLADNELPMSYLQEVIDFIMKNTQGVQLGGTAEPLYDPYADRNPAATFTTFESFKKPLLLRGLEAYNNKVNDISQKLSKSDILKIDSLLDNVDSPSNASALYEFASTIIDAGELVGYDLLRIIIKRLDYTDEIELHLLKGLQIIDKPSVDNGDVAKLIMIGRCVSNLLANNANNFKKFNKAALDLAKLDGFYKHKVATNAGVKSSVKEKLETTISALKSNLQLI